MDIIAREHLAEVERKIVDLERLAVERRQVAVAFLTSARNFGAFIVALKAVRSTFT